jgi:hypothetical protein
VVIGEVSGKGMSAAMSVSLLVGTVRTLAHYTQSPGEILAAINVRMVGRSPGGFAMVLVVGNQPHWQEKDKKGRFRHFVFEKKLRAFRLRSRLVYSTRMTKNRSDTQPQDPASIAPGRRLDHA